MKPAHVAGLPDITGLLDVHSMTAITGQLRRATGVDPATIEPGAIADSLAKRLREQKLEPSEYLAKLAAGDIDVEAEAEELFDALGLGETWFFRDTEPFRCLRDHALAWRDGGARPPYRVLSVPCATGEEPYSVAMVLLDAGFTAAEIHIDARDLRRRALVQAQRAVYRDTAFRGDDVIDRTRYFDQTAAGFALRREVADLVNFRRANLITLDRDVRGLYDVVLCRNVMIYLADDARARVVDSIARLLTVDGLLLTGHVEARIWQRRFTPVTHAGAFAFTTWQESPSETNLRSRPQPFTAERTGTRAMTGRASHPPGRPEPPGDLRRSVADDVVANDLTGARSRGTKRRFREYSTARALADAGQLAEAAQLCNRHLEHEPNDPEAHLLLGIIAGVELRNDAAARLLDTALYLAPDSVEAMLHRALLHERVGEAAAATALRARLERVRARTSEGT